MTLKDLALRISLVNTELNLPKFHLHVCCAVNKIRKIPIMMQMMHILFLLQ
jgi:hypothetical protein